MRVLRAVLPREPTKHSRLRSELEAGEEGEREGREEEDGTARRGHGNASTTATDCLDGRTDGRREGARAYAHAILALKNLWPFIMD